MSRNKYVKDYRLEQTISQKGRIKTGYSYIGLPYFFISDGESVARRKKTASAALVLSWLSFVAALIPRSAATKTAYVIIPFLLSAFALLSLTDTAFTAFPAREPLEHRHADKLGTKLPAASIIGAALTAGSLIAMAVAFFTGSLDPMTGDAVFAGCALIALLSEVYIFASRKQFRTREGRAGEGYVTDGKEQIPESGSGTGASEETPPSGE